MFEISLRKARTFLSVASHGSVTGAARAINRSQTSVTKSIHDLEKGFGLALFERSSRGVQLTPCGEVLLTRAREAAEAFTQAQELVPPMSWRQTPGMARFLRMDISDKWLDALLATAAHQNIAAAASHLGVTPAAVSSSLRKLEDSLAVTLFERAPGALSPTLLCQALVRHVKLARSALHHACDEISSLKGVHRGHIGIGSLPFARTIILPRAVACVLDQHPYLDIATQEGSYDDLVAALRCGDLDLIVGALRGATQDDLAEEWLLDDELSVIVRRDHPLTGKKRLQWRDLLACPWLLPRHGTPTRELFEKAVQAAGLASPAHVMETSSLVTLRGVLLESDRVTLLSRHQIHYEEAKQLLLALPFPLPQTRRPIGITHRARGPLSPPAEQLVACMRRVVDEIGP